MKNKHVWDLGEDVAEMAIKFGYVDSENMAVVTDNDLVLLALDKIEVSYGRPMHVPVIALLDKPVHLQATPRAGQTGEDLHYYHSVLRMARDHDGTLRDVDKVVLGVHDYVVLLACRSYAFEAPVRVLERRSRIHRLRYSVVWIWARWGGSAPKETPKVLDGGRK